MSGRRDRDERKRRGVRSFALLALAGWLLLAWLSHDPPEGAVWWLLGGLGFQWVLTGAVAFFWASNHARFWLAMGIGFRLIGLWAEPLFEDDHHRFLWDGRMFFVTGNPYDTAPSEYFNNDEVSPAFGDILDRINYPDVPTIYGPATEFVFFLSYLGAPGELWPWKIFLLAADVALLAMLWNLGGGESGARAAVFAAWCPLSVFETAFNAHPDGLAVSLITAALLAFRSRRTGWLGLCCGTAVAAKVFALLLVPFLLYRRSWRTALIFGAVLAACYLPFWLQGSWADWSGLRAFASEWEFNSSAYALLSWAAGSDRARILTVLLFGTGWIGTLKRWALVPGNDIPPGAFVFGLFFLLSPAFNPWYALWLLPFVALRPSWTGIAILSCVSLSYLTRQNLGDGGLDGFAHPPWVRPVEFGLMAIAMTVDSLRRTQRLAVFKIS